MFYKLSHFFMAQVDEWHVCLLGLKVFMSENA
uniref:Uncharacterized protein n=1 Tax=Anguilla anguilla TaxID=7936 RepID=A0A0E9QZE1_ANGAN